MIIYLRGEDNFRSEEALQAIVAGFKSKYDPTGTSVVRVDGESAKVEDIDRALSTPGLLSKKQLVIVKDLAKRKAAEIGNHLAELLQSPRLSPDTIVVVWERTAPDDGKRAPALYTFLGALPPRQAKSVGADYSARFDKLVGATLERWVADRAKARGIHFNARASDLLISMTGGTTRSLATEIDKLALYKPKGTITEDDVRTMVHAELEPNIFDLTDAIGAKNTARALQLLDEQLGAGAAPLYLLTMITRQVKILRQVQAGAGEAGPTIARRLGIHPFVVKKALEQVRRFSESELRTLFERSVALDEQLKIGAVEPNAGLTVLVAEACAA